MELTVLSVPGCPNAALFERRPWRAMAGLPGDRVPSVQAFREVLARGRP